MVLSTALPCAVPCTSILDTNIPFSLIRLMQTVNWCFLHLQKLMLFHIISCNQISKGRWSQRLPFHAFCSSNVNLLPASWSYYFITKSPTFYIPQVKGSPAKKKKRSIKTIPGPWPAGVWPECGSHSQHAVFLWSFLMHKLL